MMLAPELRDPRRFRQPCGSCLGTTGLQNKSRLSVLCCGMDEIEIRRSAKFLVDRRGADAAKQWAAQRALEVGDAESRAAWLRILQAIIDLSPSSAADTPFN
jgi:hypothetical protein